MSKKSVVHAEKLDCSKPKTKWQITKKDIEWNNNTKVIRISCVREEIIGKVGPYYDVRIQNKSLSNSRTTLFCMKINVSMVFNSIILLCEHI